MVHNFLGTVILFSYSSDFNVFTILSLTTTPPLISAPPSLKMNLFISHYHHKPHLYYKMPEILVKVNISFAKGQN